jgi:ABC-type phosphate/phosphonate transport system substrate-binding protein
MATAGLPMYDVPELREATDAWWSGLARALRSEGIAGVPDALARPPHIEEIWSSEDLLLSQTCGYNMVAHWRDRLTYVATPCYTAPGCEGPLYSSVILAPATSPEQTLEDLRGSRCVINGYGSHSGCNALRATVAPLARGGRFFGSVTVSGSHAQSIAVLERGEADVAAIDCVVYALITRARPELSDRVRAIGRTVSAPVGPYVTRRDVSDDFVRRLRRGLAQAIQDPRLAPAREALLLDGFEILPSERYAEIARLERDALERRYCDFTEAAA